MARTSEVTVIFRGTRVKARLHGRGDVEIQGMVDGEVTVSGEVTVTREGMALAGITAQRITVAGAVRGDLVAEGLVQLQEGARVVGDVRGARVAIAPGALLKGYVQTAAALAEQPRAASARATRPEAAPKREEARVAPREVTRAAVPVAPPVKREPEPKRERTRSLLDEAEELQEPVAARRTGVLAIAGARETKKGPPPPVVPALKKGAKASLKKKA